MAKNLNLYLVEGQLTIKENSFTTISKFTNYVWGNKVFGENHPKLLMRDDNIF